jgi:hypothetical protein
MSPIILLLLIAGTVIAVFLFLAALVWGIRTRRAEENFIPAPESGKHRASVRNDTVPDWLHGSDSQQPARANPESVPDWLRRPNLDSRSFDGSERNPIGAGPPSPFGDFLRNAAPQLSTVIDLSRMVKQMQATGEWTDAPEKRNAAIRKALAKMLEQQPDNEFLIHMRDSFQSGDGSDADLDDQKRS